MRAKWFRKKSKVIDCCKDHLQKDFETLGWALTLAGWWT